MWFWAASASLKSKARTARSFSKTFQFICVSPVILLKHEHCLWWWHSPDGGRALHFYNIWGRQCHRSARETLSTHRNSMTAHWFFQKVSEFSESNPITVNSDGLMSHFLTCSDGSLTLPVGFRETYDKQQNSINTLPAIFISVHFGLR